jgi:hypothetical protein
MIIFSHSCSCWICTRIANFRHQKMSPLGQCHYLLIETLFIYLLCTVNTHRFFCSSFELIRRRFIPMVSCLFAMPKKKERKKTWACVLRTYFLFPSHLVADTGRSLFFSFQSSTSLSLTLEVVQKIQTSIII